MTLQTAVFAQGTHGARPAAASANNGYYYFETDTGILFQSTGSVWQALAPSMIAVNPSGLTGATTASRYAGATASGSPVSGTFLAGDYVIDLTGSIWICTAGGSPGTWAMAGAGQGRALIGSEQTPSGVGTVTWSSIPATYKKLIIEFAIRTDQATVTGNAKIQFNADGTVGNYRKASAGVYGSNQSAFETANDNNILQGIVPGSSSPANSFAVGIIEIPQYANANILKGALLKVEALADVSSILQQHKSAGLTWNNVAAINQIDLILGSSGNYVANSVLRLYGEN
jgi:hypothetical protein